MSNQSPSQTVGPFFHFGLIFPGENVLVNEQTRGQHILIRGKVLDGDGAGIPDAMVETWQADAAGIYNHPADPRYAQADPNFPGFGRATTDKEGIYEIRTVKPGCVAWPGGGEQAPHISVRIFARGMLIHAQTRLYFSDEAANQADPVLNLEEVAGRRETLIAARENVGGQTVYRFDVHMQGERETVFFNP